MREELSTKKRRYCIYLNNDEKNKLDEICKKYKKTKSGIFRKMIFAEHYLELKENINENNKLTKELLFQIGQIGNNINQIAYRLHLNLGEDDEEHIKNETEKLFSEFVVLIEKYQREVKNNFILKRKDKIK